MALPHPTGRAGLLRIPAPSAQSMDVRYAPMSARDRFDPAQWPVEPLTRSNTFPGWWDLDLDALGLADGWYEYEFIKDNETATPIADPYADEIVRFRGYRGVFLIQNGVRTARSFHWDDELPPGVRLPNNNEIVVYEMPLRWMWGGVGSEALRQMDMGTFDRVSFERLDMLQQLGVNCIELLPVQDSPDTLHWGYGTRFFFAPDLDMGSPVDAKFFVKQCHRRGIRVFLDVVMNHDSHECPLEALAREWYFLARGDEEGPERNPWGGALFRYATPATLGYFAAREFHYEMAAYWIREYRIDGFRLDEFKSINDWDFVQGFRERSWAVHNAEFPERPFLVIAEDSYRRFQITRAGADNPNGRQVVDAMWNFSFRDEGRALITDQIATQWLQPSRTERIQALISGSHMWDSIGGGSFREGYRDLAQSVNYLTSHDVRDGARLMNYIFGGMLEVRGVASGTVENIRQYVDNIGVQSEGIIGTHEEALERIRSAFAVLMTAAGIPMFLAGEEFADVHDLSYTDDSKMSDPVDWRRLSVPGHQTLWNQVGELVRLRTSHPALQRNEIAFFYFHPELDGNAGARVFAYARTAGHDTGAPGQVAVVANMGHQDYPSFVVPWPWGVQDVREIAPPERGGPLRVTPGRNEATLSLAPFQARVFRIPLAERPQA